MNEYNGYKNVLCIRADNMGDVIMASPAFRALKETFGSKITLLTSKAGSVVTPYLDMIDEVIVTDLPWLQNTNTENATLESLAEELRQKDFDAAIIFTVYSQSALPAAMLTYMAGIPVRIGYARENPYQLLTHWLPDPEPYTMIRHQVERDLALVEHIGAKTAEKRLLLNIAQSHREACGAKLTTFQIDIEKPFLILHPGVSEQKREYPAEHWIETGKALAQKYVVPLLVSGSAPEKQLADHIAGGIGAAAVSVAGLFSLGEFIGLIEKASLLISVNTGTIHIAAAMQTPMVVLYAQTNPQHTPWMCEHRILEFSVPEHLRSRNTIIQHVTQTLYANPIPFPTAEQILKETDLLNAPGLLQRPTSVFE